MFHKGIGISHEALNVLRPIERVFGSNCLQFKLLMGLEQSCSNASSTLTCDDQLRIEGPRTWIDLSLTTMNIVPGSVRLSIPSFLVVLLDPSFKYLINQAELKRLLSTHELVPLHDLLNLF